MLGETYNVGGWNEKANLDIVHTVCALLDELCPRADGAAVPIADHLRDRPARGMTAVTPSMPANSSANWAGSRQKPSKPAFARPFEWYLDNSDWVSNVHSGRVPRVGGRKTMPDARMKILLLGKNGQVGWELQRSLAPLGELLALDSRSPSTAVT